MVVQWERVMMVGERMICRLGFFCLDDSALFKGVV